MPKQALIAGGGIGGLAAAIALGRSGIAGEVLERSHFTEETGAGIQLGPNATRALAALGVLEAIEPHGFKPNAVEIYDGLSGRKLSSLPLGEAVLDRYGAPYLTLRRADLHAGLRAGLRGLSSIVLRPGFELTAIDAQSGDGVVARAADGSEASGTYLIGADGLWSSVRTIVSPTARLRFTGATAWRTQLIRNPKLPAPFAAPVVGLWLGPHAHLVHYPVGGGSELNVVAVTEGGAAGQGWSGASDAKALLASFARWTKEARSVLDRADSWRNWSLYRLTELKRWSTGLVTLLGDAAHPVLPYLAQGAALAIEDAVTLAACLAASSGDAAKAFDRYERSRCPRAARIEQASRRMGWLYHLGPPLAQARNFVLAQRNEQTALQRFNWLYGYDGEAW
jgi:2-polyprenyl-6-methoxyphenol hydroxylase-like FAD-dependent oxidoreductase